MLSQIKARHWCDGKCDVAESTDYRSMAKVAHRYQLALKRRNRAEIPSFRRY